MSLVGFSDSFEPKWLKVYVSSGIDIAVIRGNFFNATIHEGVGEKLRSMAEVANVAPIILNLMDLTPDMNAVFYGWPKDSFEFDPLEIMEGRRFHADQPEIMLGEVLADEPTGNLDSENSGKIMTLLSSIRTQRNMTLIVVTHEEEIARRAQRGIRLCDGRI